MGRTPILSPPGTGKIALPNFLRRGPTYIVTERDFLPISAGISKFFRAAWQSPPKDLITFLANSISEICPRPKIFEGVSARREAIRALNPAFFAPARATFPFRGFPPTTVYFVTGFNYIMR
jgi:hypothetical protein